MLAGSALPPPAASSSPTIPMLGPSPGGDLAGDKPQGHPHHCHPAGKELGCCPSAPSPSPPTPGSQNLLWPSTERDASCSGAYLHSQAASRKPNTLAPLLGGCQPRVHLCFAQTRRGQWLPLWARPRGSVGGIPGQQHGPPRAARTEEKWS